MQFSGSARTWSIEPPRSREIAQREMAMTMVTSLMSVTDRSGPIALVRSRRQNSADQASRYMQQLRSNLEVRLQSIDTETLSEHQKQIYARIADELRAPVHAAETDAAGDWDEIYKLERMIALLLSGAPLRQEIAHRLAEMTDQKVPEAESLRREYGDIAAPNRPGQPPSEDDGVQRNFLLRAMEMLQRAAKQKYLASPIRKEATKKILLGVFVAFLMLIVPYVLLSLNYDDGEVGPWWSHLMLYTAVVSGGLGAFFSRLIVLQRDWPTMALEEVCLHNEWPYALLRAGVGMCGALILYYFLVSGLIEGSMFPQMGKVAINLLVVEPPGVHMAFATPSRDFALLTVWCFLAGFSELLVTGLLAKTERQFCMPSAGATAH
jgi:hypothetical protein